MEDQEYRCKYCDKKVAKYATVCSKCSTKLKLLREIKARLLAAKREVQSNAK